MVAARASVSPTMSPAQQKLMQYLPVFFAVFQVFFLAALVVYYIFQTLIRIAQQFYITKRFYGHEDSLGRQAQRAGEAAREEARKGGQSGGLFAQAKRDLAAARGDVKESPKGQPSKSTGQSGGANKAAAKNASPPREISSKRVTPAKSSPAKSSPAASEGKGRPTPSRKDAQANRSRSSRPGSGGKKRR
jgi:YidC/Oxa1 family membrane protein insertase